MWSSAHFPDEREELRRILLSLIKQNEGRIEVPYLSPAEANKYRLLIVPDNQKQLHVLTIEQA